MENTDCTTRNDDKESLLRFLQDADCLDGGMTRQMIYHGDNGWVLEKI